MSQREYETWLRYRRKWGPFNQMIRIEGAIARAVSPFLKGDKSFLLPWPKEPEPDEEEVATLQGVMAILKSSAARSRKPGSRRRRRRKT
jgi:hypothetical protein